MKDRIVKTDLGPLAGQGFTVQAASEHRRLAAVFGKMRCEHEVYSYRREHRAEAEDESFAVALLRRTKDWKPTGPFDRPQELGDACQLQSWRISLPFAAWELLKYNRQSLRRGWSTWAVIAHSAEMSALHRRVAAVNARLDGGRMRVAAALWKGDETKATFYVEWDATTMTGNFLKRAEDGAIDRVRAMFRQLRNAWRETAVERADKTSGVGTKKRGREEGANC